MSTETINALVAGNVMLLMLAFARIGTALLMMPAFGETRIPAQHKIAFSFLLSLTVYQALPLPEVPGRFEVLVVLILIEMTVGVFIGLGGRVFMMAFHILGAQIGFAAGLSNALAPPDSNLDGANAVASLLHLAGLVLIFATNTHFIMIEGLVLSYQVIPAGSPILGDLAEQMARIGSSAFYIAASVGAPFLIFSILINMALGLANRVMPSMQVFFVAAPGLIIVFLGLLALLVPSILSGTVIELGNWSMDLVR